jgi:DNA replication protein DnaC
MLEKLQPPSSLRGRMEFHSSYCDKHPFYKNGEEVPNPIQKMIINGNIVCPRCELEKDHQRMQEEIQSNYDQLLINEKYNTLFLKSITEDKTLLDARFSTYITAEEEETANKNTVMQCLERYKKGEIFNLILQGKQGTGKSHLAYSTLFNLNEIRKYSCLFISVDAMLRKIKDSFGNKESKYTEEYFNDLLSSVDFLVLDDIGAETGAIDTAKTATDFVQRVLYGITTVRQDKATIVTTNLDSKTLFSMYDKKLISRLFKKPKYVIFRDTKDKRTSNIPF